MNTTPDSETEKSLNTALIKDDYYFPHGNCVIQVENSLFRVHRYLLERDSPFFRTLFSLPQEQAPSTPGGNPAELEPIREGDSDENPIICQDSADDFRALCWALYAKPRDIVAQQDWNTVDIPRLIRVAAISHKYENEYFRDWSLDLIDMHSSARPRELIARSGLWAHADRILEISYECERLPLVERVQEEWLRVIETSGVEASLAAFEAALDIAERSSHLRRFHGKIYYTYLKATGAFLGGPVIGPGVEVAELVNHGPKALNGTRSTRLQQGFWSLVQLQLRLLVPLKINGGSCVSHTSNCLSGWDGWWKLRVGSISPPTCVPGEVLQQIRDKLLSECNSLGVLQYSHANPNTYRGGNVNSYVYCGNLIQRQIQEMIALFHDSLAD